MQKMDELRKRQVAITADFKSRAQKAEKILGEIDVCQNKLASLNESLSALLGIEAVQAKKAAKFPKAKSAKTVKVIPTVKPPAGPSLKEVVREFLTTQGKPMRIAEIVQGMKKAGQVFQTKKPVVTMRFLLYNNKKMFKKVARGTFAVMSSNVQPAGPVKVAKVQQVKVVKLVKAAKSKALAKKAQAPTLKSSVRNCMLTIGKPMKVSEIVKAMQKSGYVFESKNPFKALNKLLYKNHQVFKRVNPGTFKAV